MVDSNLDGSNDTKLIKNHVEIRDVWTFNFEDEAAKIREIIQNYPYVAMVRILIPLKFT